MGLPDSRRVSRVPRYSGVTKLFDNFAYGPLTLFGRPFQTVRLSSQILYCDPTTPKSRLFGLGSSLFARRYWGNRVFFPFPGYLDVSVPRVLPPLAYEFSQGYLSFNRWVAPFGYLRVTA